MKFAFYKGKGNFVDKMIRIVTHGKYSHCELIFSDGMWFSADSWENKCRYKDEKLFNPNNWDFIDFDYNEKTARMFCDSVEGKEYDYQAIALWLLPDVFRDNREKWYCSEVCNEAVGFPRFKISPSAFYNKIAKWNS